MCLGVPMKVIEILPDYKARVEAGSVSIEISTQLLENVELGQYVIVHAGFAIQAMDSRSAGETLNLLGQLFGNEGEPK